MALLPMLHLLMRLRRTWPRPSELGLTRWKLRPARAVRSAAAARGGGECPGALPSPARPPSISPPPPPRPPQFHPNIYPDGTLCMDLIQDNWSPIYSVCSILIAIRSLLTDPNFPARPD